MVGWSSRNRRDEGPYVPLTPEQKERDIFHGKILNCILIGLIVLLAILMLGNKKGEPKTARVQIIQLMKYREGIPVPMHTSYMAKLNSPNKYSLYLRFSGIGFDGLKEGDSVEVTYTEQFFYNHLVGNNEAHIKN